MTTTSTVTVSALAFAGLEGDFAVFLCETRRGDALTLLLPALFVSSMNAQVAKELERRWVVNRCGAARRALARTGLVRREVVRPGLVWRVRVRHGLVYLEWE